jgi:hypothetical protein
VGNFCDLQVRTQPDSSGIDQTIEVMPVATTTYNYGYNYGDLDGCTAIEKTAGSYAMAVLYPYMQAKTVDYTYPGDASTSTFAVSNNVVTRSVAFGTEDIETLIPGAIVAFSTAAAQHGFSCVAQVAAMPTAGSATFTITAPPSKWTASTGYGQTACSTVSAAVSTMFVYGAASALYFDADDDLNPNKFSNFAAGDWVTVSAAGADQGASSEASVTVQVETATTSSLIFSMGSLPNGGGMHPVLPSRGRVSNKLPRLTAYATGPSVYHVPTTGYGRGQPGAALLVQMYSSTSGASTDTAATDSAAAVARVLTGLPNQAVPEISVAMTSNALSLYAYTVTFTHAGNSGNQHSIVMNSEGCNVDGCQPRYDGVRTQHIVTASGITVASSSIAGTDIAVGISGMTAGGGDVVTLYGANVVPGESLKTSSVATTTATLIGTATAASSGVVTMVVAKSSSDGSGVSDWTTGEGVKSATYEITRGTYEATECSSRGTCDRDSGMCECAPGYTGISCATQTIIM